MNKLKISLTSTTIFPAPHVGYGGLEAVVGALAKELDEMGHDVRLFAPSGSYAPKNGHHYSPGPPGTISEEDAMKMYLTVEQSKKAFLESDVVHSHDWSYMPYPVKDFFPALKMMHTHHGMDHGWRVAPPWPKMNLCGISASHAARLTQYSGRPWTFVYNGVDTSLYPFSKNKGDRLLYLSRLWPYKGPVQAIDYAEKAGLGIDIVGGSFGDEPNFVEEVKARAAKYDKATMWGEVDHDTKVRLLQQAKAVLLPIQTVVGNTGWCEPLGLASIECNLTGTPIIVGSNGGWRETVDHETSGFLCTNEHDYLDAISRLDTITPEACRKQGEKFNARRMANNYVRLYKNLLENFEW